MAESVKPDPWQWLTRRTYHQRDFDLKALAASRSGSVSVVLPARNEAATVGQIAHAIRTRLIDEVSLVDELVVMDHGSTDATARIAKEAGASVVAVDSVLPDHGTRTGKGEVLWKALAATSGDVVAYIDADIEDFDPMFVVGLLGPLLTDDTVVYVKGFYERPLAERDRLHPTGGGRVTELVARPWLNMFWPHLSGFVQPLAGEQAGRRSALESVPFASHYGVEIGLLIDLANAYGVDALAQVDLERRVHRNQTVPQLGRMAFVIQQALMARLAREGRLNLADPPLTALHQFKNRGRDYRVVSSDLAVVDRPPMASVRR